MRRAVLNIGP